jgi:hypothetical protein
MGESRGPEAGLDGQRLGAGRGVRRELQASIGSVSPDKVNEIVAAGAWAHDQRYIVAAEEF